MSERLVKHVAQFGHQQLEQLTHKLNENVELVQLKWHVLLVRAGNKLFESSTAPQWEDWELHMLRMVSSCVPAAHMGVAVMSMPVMPENQQRRSTGSAGTGPR